MADGLTVSLSQRGPIALEVEFTAAAGQTLALIGPSGAGKTTVLRVIAGLYRPEQGRITCGSETWLDRAIGIDLPTRDRRVGIVFQSYALFPHKTAAENIAEAMLDRPPEKRRAEAKELLERVHLDGLGDRLPSALSGGQQQRVALARALARDPMALLLDEPFSAVDYPTRRSLHNLLGEIKASTAMPIVIVSHDVEDAARSADALCLLQEGEVRERGNTRALLNDPDSQTMRWLSSGN